MSRGRRHTLALGAAKSIRSGMAPDAALAAALDGKTLAATDRTLVEQELAELLERDPPPVATDVTVPDDDGSVPDDPVIAPPGAAERDAEVERIATGTASARAKNERRSTTERLDAALADLDAARTEVRRLRFLQLADALATFVASKPAATVLRSAVHAGFWSEAESVARRGCEIAGITTPAWVDAADGGRVIDVSLAVWAHDDASDTCEVTIDGRRVASVQFAAVEGEMQIVPYALNGAASAKAARSLLFKIDAD